METTEISAVEKPVDSKVKTPASESTNLPGKTQDLQAEGTGQHSDTVALQNGAMSPPCDAMVQEPHAMSQQCEAMGLKSEAMSQQPGATGLQPEATGLKPGALSPECEAMGQQAGATELQAGATGLKPGAKSLTPEATGLKPDAMGLTQGAMLLTPGATGLKAGAMPLHSGAAPLKLNDRRQRDVERFGKGNIAFLSENDVLMPFTDRITLVFTSGDTVKDYLYTKDLSDHYYEKAIKSEAERTIKHLNESYEKVIHLLNLNMSRKTYFHLFKQVRSSMKIKRHDLVLPGKITNILLYGSLFYGFYYSDISGTFRYPHNTLKRIFQRMKKLGWLHLHNSFANRYFFLTQEGRTFLQNTLSEQPWTQFSRTQR